MIKYLVCDLDSCLIKTDALYEQWFSLLKENPLVFFLSLFWLLKGRAYFKHQIAAHTGFQAHLLPYREDVLNFLKDFKNTQKGEIILASASPAPWVQAVANHLGIFNHVLASSPEENLKGGAKLRSIQKLLGENPFAYIGDHAADLEIWRAADEVIAVNASTPLRAKINALKKTTRYINDKPKNTFGLIIKQIRPHQWVKNVLILLPALAGHKLMLTDVLLNGLLALVGFSLSASFVYVLNDLLDLPSDRNHHSKKNRPFASGNLSIQWGLLLLPSLLLGVGLMTVFLPLAFSFWILTYLGLNLAYSLYLKQSVMVDVIILSLMYTLRIFAGSSATDVPVSEWLLSFSTLFFFSLACIKRYTEIIRSKTKLTIDGRGYRQLDYPIIQSLGASAGILSILVILLYLQSKEVRALYNHPELLWCLSPILLFWISRMWLLANRDEVNDDPVVFAVKDRASWICFALVAAVLGIAL